MDAATALGLAAAAVQFVDFAEKIFSGSRQIFKSASGQLDDHAVLELAAKSLSRISVNLARSLAETPEKLSENEKELRDVCGECRDIASKLQQALDELKLEDSPADEARRARRQWKSILHALKTVWNKEEIERLQRRLEAFRQQLLVSILVTLRDPVSHVNKQLAQVNDSMETVTESSKSLGQSFLKHIDESRKWRADLLEAIHASREETQELGNRQSGQPPLLQFYDRSRARGFSKRVLNKLCYAEMPDRHDRIPEAHQKTFEWIYQTPNDEKVRWQSFVEWLQDDTSIYFITGKAGAGKSTLMKFLRSDPRAVDIMRSSMLKTPKPTELVTAGFYFWNSGTAIQMSQLGLLRTLLFEILSQCKDLLPFAFPDRWEAYYLFDEFPEGSWTWLELVRALKSVIKEGLKARRFFFMIDGLDEFAGDPADLLALLKTIESFPNVKMCLASRPWNVFEDAFKDAPSLRLQDLTYPDIVLYVSTKLHDNPGFIELEVEDPRYASSLVEQIAEKSAGVFLWVTLVVTSLLSGLTDGDSISDLEQRLAALPPNLEALFSRMLDSLEQRYKADASRMFQLVRFSTELLSPLQLSFADYNDIQPILEAPVKPLTAVQKRARAERMRRRVNSRCKGLLETAPSPFVVADAHGDVRSTIQYLHRTVKDFLHREDVWKKITAATEPSYNPHLILCARHVLWMKTSDRISPAVFWWIIRSCLRSASAAFNQKLVNPGQLVEVVDGLHAAAIQVFRSAVPTCSEKATDCPCLIMPPSGDFVYSKDFFNLAVHVGLHWYVKFRAESNSLRETATRCDPLYCAVSHFKVWQDHASSQRELKFAFNNHSSSYEQTVRLLLEGGMDPNRSVGGAPTPWEVVVNELHGTLPEYARGFAVVFIEYGAHPKVPGAQRVIDDIYAKNRHETDPTCEDSANVTRASTEKRSFSAKIFKNAFQLRRPASSG